MAAIGTGGALKIGAGAVKIDTGVLKTDSSRDNFPPAATAKKNLKMAREPREQLVKSDAVDPTVKSNVVDPVKSNGTEPVKSTLPEMRSSFVSSALTKLRKSLSLKDDDDDEDGVFFSDLDIFPAHMQPSSSPGANLPQSLTRRSLRTQVKMKSREKLNVAIIGPLTGAIGDIASDFGSQGHHVVVYKHVSELVAASHQSPSPSPSPTPSQNVSGGIEASIGRSVGSGRASHALSGTSGARSIGVYGDGRAVSSAGYQTAGEHRNKSIEALDGWCDWDAILIADPNSSQAELSDSASAASFAEVLSPTRFRGLLVKIEEKTQEVIQEQPNSNVGNQSSCNSAADSSSCAGEFDLVVSESMAAEDLTAAIASKRNEIGRT